MSALQHFLEEAGIATAGVSLVREHTAAMRPPRALWVPFPLGRPLGAPNDPGLQHAILKALLALFERESGPVLEDFEPEVDDHGAVPGEPDDGQVSWACPVSFPPPPVAEGDLAGAVREEIGALAPWYAVAERAKGERGAHSGGVTGQPPDALLARLAGFLEAGTLVPANGEGSAAEALRLTIEDLKRYYLLAATAKPSGADPGVQQDWLWRETALGAFLKALAARAAGTADVGLRTLAESALVPRAYRD